MKQISLRIASMLPALCCAMPALAGDGTQVPEGSAAMLLALGVIGVIVGRRGAMRPRDDRADRRQD